MTSRNTVCFIAVLLSAAALAAPRSRTGGAGGAPQERFRADAAGNLRLVVKLADPRVRPTIAVAAKSAKLSFPIGMAAQKLDEFYCSYQERAQKKAANPKFYVPFKTVKDCGLDLGALGITYFPWPRFYDYDHAYANRQLSRWLKELPLAYERPVTFDFVTRRAENSVDILVNGQFARRMEGSGPLVSVSVSGLVSRVETLEGGELGDLSLDDSGPSARSAPFRPIDDRRSYSIPLETTLHASPLLASGARLSVGPGVVDFNGTTIDVARPENSLDLGRHRVLAHYHSLFEHPYNNRTPFAEIPEYMLYSVPSDVYTHAWILFADLPQEGRVPSLETQVGRQWSDAPSCQFAYSGLDLSDPAAAGARRVGELAYREGGKAKKSPLWLVRHDLRTGGIIDVMNAKGRKRLDFEILGAAPWKANAKSSIQVFGVALERSPWRIDIAQSETGNVFAGGESPETGFRMSAAEPNARGRIEYRIYSWDHVTLERRAKDFELGAAREEKVVKVDLSMPSNGWYGVDFDFLDGVGRRILSHRASFALLGEDTREAGVESPYAVWFNFAKVKGEFLPRHNSNPDRVKMLKLAYKMGARRADRLPLEREDEFPDMKMTIPLVDWSRPPSDDPAAIPAWLDAVVREVRERLEKFPSARIFEVLHESGGRDIARELIDREPVVQEYRGAEGDREIYWITELCRRIRREFPQLLIQIGNGSSSSQRIADLCSKGLDLNLVDLLGIESKGFHSVPEERANRESPGMAWALRETGRRFGFDKPVSASFEYVFRPERGLPGPDADFMFIPSRTVRDFLVSLSFHSHHISSGHPEDCASSYYDTNWGAGGFCLPYPYDYPKRTYVCVAALTKALDKADYQGCIQPDTDLSTYVAEFVRHRKVEDWAYACWTPEHPARARLRFPKGARLERHSMWGVVEPVEPDADGAVEMRFSGRDVNYLVSSVRAVGCETFHDLPKAPAGTRDALLARLKASDVAVSAKSPGGVFPRPGKFTASDADDPQLGAVVRFSLDRGGEAPPPVVGECASFDFRKPVAVRALKDGERLGAWVRGNSAWGDVKLRLRAKDAKGNMSEQTRHLARTMFEGWRFCTVGTGAAGRSAAVQGDFEVVGIVVESSRKALKLDDMRDVKGDLMLGPLCVRTSGGAGDGGAGGVGELDDAFDPNEKK